jgi:hypothetical protein
MYILVKTDYIGVLSRIVLEREWRVTWHGGQREVKIHKAARLSLSRVGVCADV